MLARAERLNLDLIESGFTRKLLKTIADESLRLQDESRPLVAFQGEHGAYGEVASRSLIPDGAYIPCFEFIDVFRGVEQGHFDLGVVPVENSLEGAVPHKAGRLFAVLQLFADAGINLTRIASMPLRSDPGNYSFFLDFEGCGQDKKVGAVLDKLEALTIWLKLLGSYPAHHQTT